MKAELILVGQVNKSVVQAASKFGSKDISVGSKTNIEVDSFELKKALKTAIDRSQLVVIVGGIGFDEKDITIKTVSDAIGAKTVCDQTALTKIADYYASINENLPDGAFKGAVVPKGAKVFYSENGKMGCALTAGKQCIVMLPDDKAAVTEMMKEDVLPIAEFLRGNARHTCTFYATDVSDEAIETLKTDVGAEKGIELSLDYKEGVLKVVLTTSADTEENAKLKCTSIAVRVRSALGDAIYSEDDRSIEQIVVELLREQGKMVATAESCTAGLLSKRLTDVSGSSDVFSMGIAAYSADIKAKVLGVPRDIINEKGTVSRDVAESMATNVRRLSGCDFGVGITGVAGDSFENKPSGLVYVSLCNGSNLWTKKLDLSVSSDDSRTIVRNTAATIALDMLRRVLLGVADGGKAVSVDRNNLPEGKKPTTIGSLSFLEGAIKTADETGVVEDGIILPADEAFITYEQVEDIVLSNEPSEDSEFNFAFDMDNEVIEAPAEDEEEVIQPVEEAESEAEDFVIASPVEEIAEEEPVEEEIAEEPVEEEIAEEEPEEKVEMAPVVIPTTEKNEIIDDDFVIKEDAVFETEKEVSYVKKENAFVRAIKNFIPWKGDTLSKILTKILFVCIIIALIVSSGYVGDFMIKYFENKSVIEDARDKYNRGDDTIDPETGVFNRYDLLLEQNTDCIGWITVPNTNVDNPIYQTTNNDYYLEHNGIKEKSVYGAIFADYRDIISRAGNSKNITLYGHHMKDGSMFAQLHRYKNISFYKENPVITFDTIYGTGGQYKVFACMITNADSMDDNGYFFDFAAPSFRSDADFMSWIEQIRRRSLYNTAVDITTSDQILTLSTCTYEVKDVDLLCVVFARKVREGESVAVNTGDVTANSKIIYPQAWYDHFNGVKPTYADGLYTWVSGDYDREDVNAPGSIAPESVVSDITSNGSSTTSEAPTSSTEPTSSTPSVTPGPGPGQSLLPTPTNSTPETSEEPEAPMSTLPPPVPIG